MQILPDTFIDRTEDSLDLQRNSYLMQASFEQEFRKSLQQAEEDARRKDRTAEENDANANSYLNALMTGAPYNPMPDSFSPFAPQTVRFTSAEMDALISGLDKDKVSARALAALKDLSRIPGGPTADQVIRTAHEALAGTPQKLDRQDEAQLLSLSRKVGREQGKELKNLFTDGTPKTSLGAFLAGLDDGAQLTVSREEMTALIKALGLSENTGKNLLRNFGDNTTLSLSGRDLRSMLEAARKELDTASAEMDKLLASLEQRMKPVLNDAKKREEMERLAGMREDRSVIQARMLIQDTVTQAAPGRDGDAAQNKQMRSVSHNNESTTNAKKQDAAHQTQGAEQAGTVPATDIRDRSPDHETAQNHAGERRPGFGTSPDDPHSQEKKRTSSALSPSSTSSATLLHASVTQGVGAVTPTTQPAPNATFTNAPLPTALSSRTLDQIEQAVLTASKNGVQRLEVALNPSDLGSMTVVLTSRHGEMSALIKSDRAETAALITQQVDQIRQELENQGFKVDKVDVQTQLADQQGQSWQGPDQHNSSRDMASRVEDMERLRRMNQGSGDLTHILARDMHSEGHLSSAATVAGQGLHIIA